MMRVLGMDVAVVQCLNPAMVGIHGTVALESMRMLTIVSGDRKVKVAKAGTVLRLRQGEKLVIGDEMIGRIEDRLSRGAKV